MEDPTTSSNSVDESSTMMKADTSTGDASWSSQWWVWVLIILVFIIAVIALIFASMAYHLRLRIKKLETSTSDLQAEQKIQNTRLDGIDADQVTQNTRLDGIDADQKVQDSRLSAIEAEQKTQNTNITNLQTALTTQQNINNQQAAQIAQNNIQYERYERKQGLTVPPNEAYFGSECTLVDRDNLAPSIARAFQYDPTSGNWQINTTGMYDIGARVRFTSGGQYVLFCNVFRNPNGQNIQVNLGQSANDTTTFSGAFKLQSGDQIQFRILNLDATLPLIANDPAGHLQIYLALQQAQP